MLSRSVVPAFVLGLAAAALVSFAFLSGRTITADLEWPGDPDMFRDLAIAQSIADCWCLEDPHYRGEYVWYNPLTAAVIAALAVATDAPVPLVQVRAGAWLNLLAPLGFYALAVVIVRPLAAVAALTAFLFLGPGQLIDTATYSPWLMSPNFAQAFLYLGLAVYLCAAERRSSWWWMAAGLLAGLAALAHTAVAVLLAAVVGVDVLVSLRASADPQPRARHLLLMVGTAVAVASPFLAIVVAHYRGQVLNLMPALWLDRSMELARIGSFVQDHVWRPVMAPVAIGVMATLAGALDPRRRRAMVAWAVACVLALAYSYLWQWAQAHEVTLPKVLPEFHFLRLLDAAEHMWFGLGTAVVARAVVAPLATADARALAAALMVIVACVAVTVLAWPRYERRHDRVVMRTASQQMYRDIHLLALRDWLRTSTTRDAVFLADAGLSFSVVAPAGRHVMEVPRFFSNTFVDWAERHNASNAMWGALTASNCGGLSEISQRFGITHAIDQAGARWTRSVEANCGWTPVFAAGDWRVFARPAPVSP